jgi:predicted tellurium resistance membrane protein TerC
MIYNFIRQVADIYNVWLMVLTVAIGIFILLADSHQLNDKNERDRKIARVIGWVYTAGGLLLFIGVKFIV